MAELKTNYIDDQLDKTKNTKRKYNVIQNSDGTISFDDVTEYTVNGDKFGAYDINTTNAAINTNASAITQLNSNLQNLNSGIKYNKSTDYVELYDGEKWIEWRKGNINKRYLIADGVANAPYNGQYILTPTSNFTLQRIGTTGYLNFKDIDAIGYSRAVITFTKISGSYGAELWFKNGSTTVTSGNGNVGQSGTLTIQSPASGNFEANIYASEASYRITNLWLE